MTKKSNFFLFLLFWHVFGISCPKEKLFKAHNAIFHALLPIELKNPKSDEKTMIDQANQEIWQKIEENQELSFLLAVFCDVKALTNLTLGKIYTQFILKDEEEKELIKSKNIEPIIRYLKSINKYFCHEGIFDLSDKEILYLLDLLIKNESNYWRRLGFTVKTFYNSQIYAGSLGDYVSKLTRNLQKYPQNLPSFPALKTHLVYDEQKKTIMGELDYIIVGSGIAASVIAYELVKAQKKVLMIEKGPFALLGSMETMSNFHFLDSEGLRPDVAGNVCFFNGQGLGGGGTVNMNIFIPNDEPFVKHRLDSWHKRGLIPEDLWTLEQIKAASAWVESILQPREVTLDDVDSNNQHIALGASVLGISYKMHKLTTYSENDCPYEVTNKKSNLERFIVPSLLESTPLSILPNCEVTDIRIKNNTAFGVKCEMKKPWIQKGVLNDPYSWQIPQGTKIKIKAKKVILAAGNLGSTALLLKNKKIENINKGKGIIAHPAFPVMALYDQALKSHGSVSGVYIDEFINKTYEDNKPNFLIETSQGNSSLGAILTPGDPNEVGDSVENLIFEGGGAVVLFDTVSDKNQIKLDMCNRPQIHYELSPQDKERAIEGICHLIDILLSAGAKKVIFSTHEDILNNNNKSGFNVITDRSQIDLVRKNLKLISNQIFIMSGHMMGGNKIGTSKENSVVDKNYQVHGINNLFIADSSILPESPHVNPMPFIYAIAKIFVDKELKKEDQR